MTGVQTCALPIPRFCYHDKLSVAANCRMCLVEVEKAPKPMPACATPIMEGMVVHTRSPKAIEAQKSVMEFLLINHPLDCPICDQGGECELQDLSMGFGGDASQYTDVKRVVFDKDIGPLISTELTRCIQCTRCVRFGEEIAGMRELGMTDRGDRAQIGTFIQKSINSEMSGNIIDICPVGALTAKPSRFSGRAWEMQQHASVSPHDSVGSNLFIHTLDGKVNRVVPRENEAINEVWISDRDRFSYQGIYADDRATSPMIKQNGKWLETDWSTALQYAVDGIKLVQKENSADELACWMSPNATLEEHYLAQKLCRKMGSHNIDHRLRQTDFIDQDFAPVMPWLGKDIQTLERLQAILLIGSHVRKDQPLIAHRFRKAFRHHQLKISMINPRKFKWRFETSNELVSSAEGMVRNLAAVAKAVGGIQQPNLTDIINNAVVNDEHKSIAEELTTAGVAATIFIGSLAVQHPQYSILRALSNAIAKQTGATLAYLPEAANTAAAYLAGSLPNRLAGGVKSDSTGANIVEMLQSPKKALLTFGVEPEYDIANPAAAIKAAKDSDFCVAINSYVTDSMKDYADVILPLASFSETSGTFVNAEGYWQSVNGATAPLGESRPGWKILRVLGHRFEIEGFGHVMDVNLTSHQRLMKHCIPFLRHGINPAIIIIASKNVPAPGPGASAYSAAKAGLTQLARVAAFELGKDNIRVNTVPPNAVFDTGVWSDEMLQGRAKSYGMSVDQYKANNVLHTAVTSTNVAAMVCAMAGQTFAKTTGSQVPVDGGNERVI